MESTKKCRECQMDIPKKARRCPHCRAKQGIGAGGLFIAILFIGITASVVISSLNDSSSTASIYTPPSAKVSTFEMGTYEVESEEFQHISPKEVNLWQSYSDRKKVGAVKEHAVVEVTSHDDANDYCKVVSGEQTGWMACGWLVKQ